MKYIKSTIQNIADQFGYRIVRSQKNHKKVAFPNDFDARNIEIIRLVQEKTMTSPERLNCLMNSVKYLVSNCIEGSVVECGVWKGGSMMAVAYMLKELSDINRDLYLFDTYEGMPPPTQKDRTYRNVDAYSLLNSNNPAEKQAYLCYSSLQEVQENLDLTDYPSKRIHFIKGKVEDTIPEQAPQTIALLRLDTDWYESTKHELEHLFPRLVPGGVIIIDDYGYWKGCKEATDEYIRDHNLPILLNRIDSTGRVAIKWQA
ncbi:MAG: TylF/MycF family methyltransferase [Tildeniella torsiva UHER 1998/13D]|jgi:hypothetical protein|nr:TylF/MycF family methyltransferase [Tildeniella torsiva UHER 1998/13D]